MSSCIFFSLSPFFVLHAHFCGGHFLIQFAPIRPSLPSVQFLGNPLDACPIKTLLEVVGGAMSCEDTVQVSFPHKCDQFSWCNALNLEGAITFLDISFLCCLHSSFTFLGAPLSSMVDYLKYSQDASAPRGPQFMHQFPFSPRSSCVCAHGSLIIIGRLIILGQGLQSKNVN